MTENITATTIFGDGGLDADERYWAGQLDSDLPMIVVPTDFERRSCGAVTGRIVEAPLDPAMSTKVLEVCNRNQSLIFAFFVASLKICLQKYSAHDDIVVGAEPYQDSTDGTGASVWLPLRSHVHADLSVKELLEKTKQCITNAYAHQRYFTNGLSWPSSPQVGVVVVFRDASDSRALPTLHGDICVVRITQADVLILSCQYTSELYRRETIEMFLSHCLAVVSAIVNEPTSKVSELQLIDEFERAELVRAGTGGRINYGEHDLVPTAIARQAAKSPDSVAVTFDGEHLSFAELNHRADLVARYLQRLGVAPEVRIAVWMERSLELVISLVGILKAGGCYVPFESEWPLARAEELAKSAGVAMMVTDVPVATEAGGPYIVSIRNHWTIIASEEVSESSVALLPENTAYAIFTSGSTGQPKGVMVSHRALRNHMYWLIDEYGLNATDCFFQKTPTAFDASVWEFYAPLMVGSRLEVARPGFHRDVSYLVETVRRQMVTIFQAVPSVLRMLLDEPALMDCRSLRKMFCGGESLTTELRRRFAACSAAELINLYGPTEATIDSSFWLCPPDRPDVRTSIGGPIANAALYVLGSELELVPWGFLGELCIGGDGLAIGYLARPDATAERFVPDPYSQEPGSRLYRTGDMGRRHRDGRLEFVGRRDLQIKITGYRIEPGEIEAVLGRHDAVGSCVVVAGENQLGQRILLAYVERLAQRSLDTADLSAFLRKRLPSHMVPGVFVVLDVLPRTSSGKVDRQALPDPWRTHRVTESALASTHLERSIAEIWKDILKVDCVGVNDNFFDLGGSSLLLPLLQAKLRNFRNVQIVDLFKYPTVSSLAKHIANDQAVHL